MSTPINKQNYNINTTAFVPSLRSNAPAFVPQNHTQVDTVAARVLESPRKSSAFSSSSTTPPIYGSPKKKALIHTHSPKLNDSFDDSDDNPLDRSVMGKVDDTIAFNPKEFLQTKPPLKSSGDKWKNTLRTSQERAAPQLTSSGILSNSMSKMNLRSSSDAQVTKPERVVTHKDALKSYQDKYLANDPFPARYDMDYKSESPQDVFAPKWFDHARHFIPTKLLKELDQLLHFECRFKGKMSFLVPCMEVATVLQTNPCDEKSVNGCSPLYFASALSMYLQNLRLHKVSSALVKVVEKMKALLPKYLSISAYLTELPPTSISNPKMNKYLTEIAKGSSSLLVPLGYDVQGTAQGHHILALLETAGKATTVILMDPGAYNKKKLQDTAIKLLKKAMLKESLCEMQQAFKTATVTQCYTIIKKNAALVEEDKTDTPFDQFTANNNGTCVPQAFQNLLYTLAKQVACDEQASKEQMVDLKRKVDALFDRFRKSLIEKFTS